MKFEFQARIRRDGFVLELDERCETEALGIVGPSGSGKSTFLDVISGMEGDALIRLDGVDCSSMPPEERGIGYVMQDSLLFPHMSVRQNLLFSPRARGLGDVVEALGISDLLDRMPGRLSGGERRRAALARAILSRPRLLLLDEPFGGLDETLRREAMSLLDTVKQSFRVPMILVSHMADEVIGLTSWAIRLQSGRVTARGPSASILEAGETRIDNYFTGTVLDRGRVRVDNVEMSAVIPDNASGSVRLACYAHDILLATTQPTDLSARNVFKTRIVSTTAAGNLTLLGLELAGLRVLVTAEAREALSLYPEAEVFAVIKASSVKCLGRDSPSRELGKSIAIQTASRV